MTFQPTACILCECNCGIEVELDGRTLARIRGDKDHPASQGYTCNKAMRLDYYHTGNASQEVFAVDKVKGGLTLLEMAPGVTRDDLKAKTEAAFAG